MTLILIPGIYAPVPAAIVQKEQLASVVYDEEAEEFTIRRRLPLKLARATWSEIKRYLREPADTNNPKPEEVLTRAESDPFSEELSKEQISVMIAQMEAERTANIAIMAEATATLDNPNLEILTRIKAYREDHPDATNQEILAAIEGATAGLII